MDLTTVRGPRKRVLLEYYDDQGQKQSAFFKAPLAERSVDASTTPSNVATSLVGANAKQRKKVKASSSETRIKKVTAVPKDIAVSKVQAATKTPSKKTKVKGETTSPVSNQMSSKATQSTVPSGLEPSMSAGSKPLNQEVSATSTPKSKAPALKGSPYFASQSSFQRNEVSDANNNKVFPMSSPTTAFMANSNVSSNCHAVVKKTASATAITSATASTSASITASTTTSATSSATTSTEASDTASAILDEIERFVTEFKTTRIKRGFTQTDVSKIIATINPNLSQTTISRFETLSLSYPNIKRLRPYFELFHTRVTENVGREMMGPEYAMIVDFKEEDVSNVPAPRRKRERRTEISEKLARTLEKCYVANPKPLQAEIEIMATHCSVDPRVIRVWFCNRRAKQRRHEREAAKGVRKSEFSP